MKALIATNEPRQTGYRVAQVEQDADIFPVSEPILFWTDCPDYIVADAYWYDPSDQSFVKFPPPPKPGPQPTTEGTQTL